MKLTSFVPQGDAKGVTNIGKISLKVFILTQPYH